MEKLKKGWHDENEAYVLKKYGDVTEDLAITRTVLAPADIPLRGLHFAIQRLFGWQNSHLHCFKLADNDFNELLERIMVDDLLGFGEDTFIEYDELSKSMYGTLFGRSTDKMLYNYDYVLNWIHEAYNIVLDRHQPVCIGRKGKMVMDDVGGMGGYARFLDAIYCSEDQEEKASYLEWAKGMGWSNRKSALKNML